MQGWITELPQPYHQAVIDLWDEIAVALQVDAAQHTTPIPHFTWHVAQSYHHDVPEIIREKLTVKSLPIITTSGLGVFPGPHPVLFIAIHSTVELLQFHQTLLKIIMPLTEGSYQLYEPESWSPHITLALGDTDPVIAGKMVTMLSERSFQWQFSLENLILVQDDPITGVFSKKFSLHF